MTQDASFTFDLFGNFPGLGQDDLSAGLGVTALAGSVAVRPDNDDDPDPVPPAPGACRPVGAPTTEPRAPGAPANFHLDEGDRGLATGWRERAGANVAIIELANEIVRDGRPATREEQARLMDALAEAATHRSLFLFNESFAATNEREGSKIAGEITKALIERGVRVAFVTHLYTFAHAMLVEQGADGVFLRAAKPADDGRVFPLELAEPMGTSFGRELFIAVIK